ncbi:MAG TPA: hypothetical protein HA283_05045 [Nanoarchaeota archaeon]|nr:hypothetical protein [Nanoarchaeota archaeon]HIH63636.1 hypothetical protein [Nanoarchaeota archaeon]HIJ10109.1 hypothetical protein [Nanoarchaeota archaeon]
MKEYKVTGVIDLNKPSEQIFFGVVKGLEGKFNGKISFSNCSGCSGCNGESEKLEMAVYSKSLSIVYTSPDAFLGHFEKFDREEGKHGIVGEYSNKRMYLNVAELVK